MSPTFADLGIPFPLFAASTDEASQYTSTARCVICGMIQSHCFHLGIGAALILACPNCHAENGLDAAERVSQSCRVCHTTIAFPDLPDPELHVCYPCLLAGEAALTKDTELGMVSWEQAYEGLTHGVPGLNHPDFELVAKEDDWFAARVPQQHLFELLRTPDFATWQGAIWLFCCQQPMIYLGAWEREMFTYHAPDGDGKAFFEAVVEESIPGLWEDELHDTTGVYVFKCAQCGRLRANWDIA